MKLIKGKYQHPDQQDKKLHGNFYQSVHHKAHSALVDRTSGKVTAHLRLVGAKIRKLKKKSANQSRPQIVTVVEFKSRVQGIEFV